MSPFEPIVSLFKFNSSMYKCTRIHLFYTYWEKSSFEYLSLYACCQTRILGLRHICKHADRIVTICIALRHDLVHRSNNLENTSSIPRESINCCFKFFPLQQFILIGVEIFASTTDDVWTRGARGVLCGGGILRRLTFLSFALFGKNRLLGQGKDGNE